MANSSFLVAPDLNSSLSADERAGQLDDFLSHISATPGARLAKDSRRGPSGYVVVEMPDSLQAELKSRFKGRLIIEPNDPLQTSSAGG